MKFIGVDIGSSSIKGAIADVAAGRLSGVARTDFPALIDGLPAGHFETDPGKIVAATDGVLRELLKACPDCAGVMFCAQMGGVVVTGQNGEALSNYISWRDQRTIAPDSAADQSCFDRARRQLGPALRREIGNELRAGSMLPLLVWLRERGRLPARATPIGMGEFVISQLCRAAPVVERTLAVGTLNLASLDWHRGAFAELGLEDLSLPRLVAVHEPAGNLMWHGRSIPCYPAVGDHQAAIAGSRLQPGELSINVSTGSQVSQLTDRFAPGDYQTRPWFGGQFLNLISHIPAGRSLQVLMDLLTELPRAAGIELASAWEQAQSAAESAPDSQLAVDLAFFSGPMGHQGSITGITTENLTVGGVFRAAFHNMAHNYSLCAARLCPARDWTNIVFSGGLVQKNALLRELILCQLGPAPHRVAAATEDTLTGLMVLAQAVFESRKIDTGKSGPGVQTVNGT